MIQVLIDTREKAPYAFKEAKVAIKTLKTGDYALKSDAGGLIIERKSVSDLFGTLTAGVERFEREMARLSLYDYPVVIVEGDQESVRRGIWNSGANGSAVLRHLFRLCVKYGVGVVFCRGRTEAEETAWGLLRARHEVKTGRLK